MIRFRIVKYLVAVGLWAVFMVQPSIPGRAFEWRYVTFIEDAPAELKAAIRNLFAERISLAEKKYPGYPVQILIGRQSDGSIPYFAETKIFYAVLAGNPEFCDELGCIMVNVAGSETDGWKSGREFRTNGALIFTDTFETLIETRSGCMTLAAVGPAILPGDVAPNGKPCANWAARERSRVSWEIRNKLVEELGDESLHFSSRSNIDSFLEFKLGKSGTERRLNQVIAELEKSHNFRWQKDGTTYRFVVDRPEQGTLYHEIEDPKIRWVTEKSLSDSSSRR